MPRLAGSLAIVVTLLAACCPPPAASASPTRFVAVLLDEPAHEVGARLSDGSEVQLRFTDPPATAWAAGQRVYLEGRSVDGLVWVERVTPLPASAGGDEP